MSDLRALLGDRYDDVIRTFVDATSDEPDYFGCSCCTSTTEADEERTGHSWSDDHAAPAARMAAHDGLAAVLPDLLAAANARAEDAEANARRFANLLGDNAKALNDALPREVLRQKAAAWDEGHLAGCSDPYSAYGECSCGPNPYRQDSEGTGAE